MPDQVFGKNEAEIEETVHQKLQGIAKEATEAATEWVNGWRNDRVTVKRKVINSLNEKLERILLQAVSDEVQAKAKKLTEAAVAEKLSDEYIKSSPIYKKMLNDAEAEFWRDFGYKMRDVARKAGDRAAQATSATYEKSMVTLIKNAVLDHFAASDGLAELAEEERRKNG